MAMDEVKFTEKMILESLKGLDDEARCAGLLHGVLRDKDGNVIDEQLKRNQFQTAGKTHVADQLAGGADAAMSHMAIGTGTGQAVGDTTLATENDREALDGGTPTHAANVVTYTRTFAAGEGTGTITEAGIFNAGSGGDMMLYNDSISFGKGAGDSLTLTWTFTVN
jgi:hypothetical protein